MWRLKRPKKRQRWRSPKRRPRKRRGFRGWPRRSKQMPRKRRRQKHQQLSASSSSCSCSTKSLQIVWEEDAWRTLEAGGEGSQSVISGYGKGKVPEKHICTNCLRKGIKCKWDEGGRGKSEKLFFFFDLY